MIFYLLLIHLFSCEKISITILGTNDIHGRVFANKKKEIKIGGLSLFSSFLNILRQTEKNLLWLDGGDQFTGTLES